jgi:hypothetical protein
MHRANEQPIESADGSRAKRQYQFGEGMACACGAKCTPRGSGNSRLHCVGLAGLDLPPPCAKTLRTSKRRHLSSPLQKISLDKVGLLMEAATARERFFSTFNG